MIRQDRTQVLPGRSVSVFYGAPNPSGEEYYCASPRFVKQNLVSDIFAINHQPVMTRLPPRLNPTGADSSAGAGIQPFIDDG